MARLDAESMEIRNLESSGHFSISSVARTLLRAQGELFCKEIADCVCRVELSENSESEMDALVAVTNDKYNHTLTAARPQSPTYQTKGSMATKPIRLKAAWPQSPTYQTKGSMATKSNISD